jgi:phosphatidate cytidylyltransferase
VDLKFAVGAPILHAMMALYLLLAVASLGVGLSTTSDSQLRKQVNAWWLLFPVVSLSLLLYPAGPLLMALLIAVLAVRELALHHVGPRRHFLAVCIALLLIQAALMLNDGPSPASILPWLLLAQALHFALRRGANQLLLLLFLLLCYSLSFIQGLLTLPIAPQASLAWYFYLCVLTALNDIAQFVSGKAFGNCAIAPRISPNKTWQGLAGGVLVSLLVSVTLGRYLQLAPVGQLLALALLLSTGGFAGDLIFSSAKRFLGIKDFSELIPGHGGILDRVDSLVLTAPLLYVALRAF